MVFSDLRALRVLRGEENSGRGRSRFALLLDEGVNCAGGLGAFGDAVVYPGEVHLHSLTLQAWIISADRFNGSAVATGTFLSYDNAVMWFVLRADAGKADFECHGKLY